MMNNIFYLILKALFLLEIFTFLSYVGKRLDKKAQVIFKIYNVINWNTNNKCIARYLKK